MQYRVIYGAFLFTLVLSFTTFKGGVNGISEKRSLANQNDIDGCYEVFFRVAQRHNHPLTQIGLKDYFLRYFKEVAQGEIIDDKNTLPLLRLFFRNSDIKKPKTKRWFFRSFSPTPIDKWYMRPFNFFYYKTLYKARADKFGVAWRFSPIQNLLDSTLQAPTRLISKNILGREKEFSLLVMGPATAGIYYSIYKAIENGHEIYIERKAKEEILKNSSFYHQLIEEDFRYVHLKDKTLNLLTTATDEIEEKLIWQEAYYQAFLIHKEFDHYFTKMATDFSVEVEKGNNLSDEFMDWSLSLPFFMPIKNYMNEGAPKRSSQFKTLENYSENINWETMQALVILQHQLFYTYSMITGLVQTDSHWHGIIEDNRWSEEVDEISSSNLFLYLQGKVSEGVISKFKMVNLLQKFYFKLYRLKMLKEIGLAEIDENGNELTGKSLAKAIALEVVNSQ